MIKIYDHNESVCCQKVRLTLAEKGVEFKNIHVAIEDGEQYNEAFLKLNPAGVVPVAVHKGNVITESTIINEYINEAFSGPQLMPTEPYWRAKKRSWSHLLDSEIHLPHTTCLSFVVALRFVFLDSLNTPEKLAEHFANVKNPEIRLMQKDAIEQGYKAPQFTLAVIAFDNMLEKMDRQLEQSPWLAGNTISLADLDVAPYIHRLESLKLSNMWTKYPKVSVWYENMKARPSWDVAIKQQHIDKWVELMSKTGEAAWAEVSNILNRK